METADDFCGDGDFGVHVVREVSANLEESSLCMLYR